MYPGVELRLLRYVIAVAEELHFSRAAAKVRVAQPSLSKQIRDLEEEIGTQLFHRTSLTMPTLSSLFVFLFTFSSFFKRTSPFTPKSGLVGFFHLCVDDHGSFRNLSVGFSPTQTSLRSVLRPGLLVQTPFAGSGMPIQMDGALLPTMSGTELSRVRTALT